MTATPPIHPVMNYSDQPRPSLFRRRRRRRGGTDKNVEDHRVFSRVLSSLPVGGYHPISDAAPRRRSKRALRILVPALPPSPFLKSVEKYTVYLPTSIIWRQRVYLIVFAPSRLLQEILKR